MRRATPSSATKVRSAPTARSYSFLRSDCLSYYEKRYGMRRSTLTSPHRISSYLPSPHRGELKMPVLDAITLVDFFHSAVTDDPVFDLTLP